jgi:hypothetical protein
LTRSAPQQHLVGVTHNGEHLAEFQQRLAALVRAGPDVSLCLIGKAQNIAALRNASHDGTSLCDVHVGHSPTDM